MPDCKWAFVYCYCSTLPYRLSVLLLNFIVCMCVFPRARFALFVLFSSGVLSLQWIIIMCLPVEYFLYYRYIPLQWCNFSLIEDPKYTTIYWNRRNTPNFHLGPVLLHICIFPFLFYCIIIENLLDRQPNKSLLFSFPSESIIHSLCISDKYVFAVAFLLFEFRNCHLEMDLRNKYLKHLSSKQK